jgi:outer membrane protein OmpA-like peptidoglycan-associated protein
MKYFLFIAGLILGNLVFAGNLEGVVYKVNSTFSLDNCLIILLEKGKLAFSTKSEFDGSFNINYKKNKQYILEVSKDGYQTQRVEIYTDNAFLDRNASIQVYLKVLVLKPKFEKMQESVVKNIPNSDIMEDIGNLSDLPEGSKIIEAKPLKFKESENTNFNVNRNASMETTSVNVEVLKKEFNKEDVDKAFYSELDKFPSSYYAEGDIYYGPAKAMLTENVKEVLDGIAVKLNSEQFSTLRIIAYADADKEVLIGDYIGKLRAEEVTKYLMSRNVDFSRLNISVIGNSSLGNGCYKDKPCSEFEHQQNRKIELIYSK